MVEACVCGRQSVVLASVAANHEGEAGQTVYWRSITGVGGKRWRKRRGRRSERK